MCKDSCAKYYQKNKERLQKKHVKHIKPVPKKKKKKGSNIDVNDVKIPLKVNNKG